MDKINERYIIINDYYIRDKVTGRKYNHKETCQQLNLLERIIQNKTILIEQLTNTLTYMEKKR